MIRKLEEQQWKEGVKKKWKIGICSSKGYRKIRTGSSVIS